MQCLGSRSGSEKPAALCHFGGPVDSKKDQYGNVDQKVRDAVEVGTELGAPVEFAGYITV